MDKVVLKIAKEINNSLAVSSDDGDELFHKINSLIQKKQVVELDFSGIDVMTSAFLNAAIGQLYNSFTSDQLNKQLKLVRVVKEDISLIKKVIERAKEYFANRKGFENSANQAFYGC